MRKWKILLPSLIATASMPLVGLVGCNKGKEHNYANDYFTFTATKDGEFSCNIDIDAAVTTSININLQYSLNGKK